MRTLLAIVVLSIAVHSQSVNAKGNLKLKGTAYVGGSGALSGPLLPQVWIDNNELTCLITSTCYNGANGKSPALTVPYSAPSFTLTLSGTTGTGGTWSPSTPSAIGTCATTSTLNPSGFSFGTNYYQTAAGLQSAITDVEKYRSCGGGTTGFIIAVNPASLDTAIGCTTSPNQAYCAVTGTTIPQTSTIAATSPIIIQSTSDSSIAALSEPVCDGGTQDNLSESSITNPGLNNPTCDGKNMFYALGPSNSSGTISGITTLSAHTTLIAGVTANVSPQLALLVNGYVSPGIAYVVDSGGGAETVTGVSGVNNAGLYGVFTKNHSAGATVVYDVGSFSLANGTSTSTSAYNYLQYMPQLQCTAQGCHPLQFCSAAPGISPACASGIGPDHWQIQDLSVSECPGPVSNCAGAANDQFIIQTGLSVPATSLTQFGQDIHLRRIWCHGDWTSLYTGTNSIADCYDIEAVKYWSVIGSKASQALRPGSEGHSGLVQAISGKMVHNTFDGSSSGIFAAGFSIPPSINGFVPFVDMQYGRNLFTFPYTWLGFQCPDVNGCGNIPNANPYWGMANSPWLNGPTTVNVSGTTVTWVSGDSFHDSTSTWPGNKIVIAGVTCSVMPCKISTMGSGTWSGTCISAPPGTCPTTLTMQTSGTTVSGAAYTMPLVSIVRKNVDEKKSVERVAAYGNTYENNDNSGGQKGICTSRGIRNASGSEAANSNTRAQNYYATFTDYLEDGSICRNTCAGRSFDGRSAGAGSGNGVSMAMQRVTIEDVLDYNISYTNPGCPSGSGFDLQVTSAGQSFTGNIACSLTAPASCTFGSSGIVFSLDAPTTQTATITATAVTSNILTVTASNTFIAGQSVSFSGLTNPSDTYLNSAQVVVISTGLSSSQFEANYTIANYSVSDSGTATAESVPVSQSANITQTCLGVACSLGANVLQVTATNNFIPGELVALSNFTGASSASLLNGQVIAITSSTGSSFQATGISGSYSTESEPAGALVNGPVGYQVLGMRAGDPVYVSGCTSSGINQTTQTLGGGHVVAAGIGPGIVSASAPWTGSWSAANLTISWPWTSGQGNTGQSDTSGTCTVQNLQGNPQNFVINHATEITDSVETLGIGPGFNSTTPASGGPPFQLNSVVMNSIMLSSATSPAAWYNNSLASSEGTKTEEFNGDQNSMTATKLVWPGRTNTNYTEFGNNPFYPAATLLPCTRPNCDISPPTATGIYFPSTSCAINFLNSCSGSVPLTLSDYHNYGLVQSGGGVSPYHNAGSDGTDIGARITNIDTLQVQSPYICPVACNLPGPFPD